MGELFKIFVCLAWRIHISNIKAKKSFFFFYFLEGSNVGHNIQFNFCNLLIFILLYNFQNFSSRASIP